MEAFLATPFWEPIYFLSTLLVVFMVVFIRYLVVSGVYHYLFFKAFKQQFATRHINQPQMDGQQAKMEIGRSALTSFIFALSGMGLILLWQGGYTKIYLSWSDYSWWYHPLSILTALFLHETYYYWLHRWMHRPKVYRLIHKWHHDSIETSSLTAFSFHPIESVLQALVIPLFILWLPLHIYSLFFLLLVMTISGTINHASVEIFPKGFAQNRFGKWMVGATHHDLHHKQFRFNFGLYFTFWDHWMKTESPDFEQSFREHTE